MLVLIHECIRLELVIKPIFKARIIWHNINRLILSCMTVSAFLQAVVHCSFSHDGINSKSLGLNICIQYTIIHCTIQVIWNSEKKCRCRFAGGPIVYRDCTLA